MIQRDLKWQVGQRFVVGFAGTEAPESLKKLVREYQVGNFILFKRNVKSRDQLRRLCQELQDLAMEYTGLPAFITIDQEGGTVTRLPEDCAITPTAMALAATGCVENAYEAGRITGCELSALGVNFNLAPVMDVNSNPQNPVIGARSYGDDPALCAAFGSAAIRGLQAGGAMSCAKHFPGHGDTAVDSHLGLPRVEKTLDELEACEFIPFRAAIEAGVSAIMTTHILFPKLEPQPIPATMSKTIMQGILRGRMGYDGLIVSDCMMMDAIAKYYGTVEGCVAACYASVDLVFICHDPELTGRACEAVAAQSDPAVMEASIARILKAKEALAKLPVGTLEDVGCEAHRAANARMREASITPLGAPLPKLGGEPFFVGCFPFVASQVITPVERDVCFPEWMQKQFGGTALVTAIDPDAEEIARAIAAAKEASCIVLCTFNAHMKAGQLVLLHELAALEKPMIVCALRDPYDLMHLPQGVSGLITYEYSADSLAALRKVLAGEIIPKGILTVQALR